MTAFAAQAQKVDADTALMAHTAAYRVLQALCQSLSDAEAIKAVFAEHGGNAVRVCVALRICLQHRPVNTCHQETPQCSSGNMFTISIG